MTRKTTSYQKGLWAEYYAAAFLILKGYRILKLRYKTPFGEADMVAKKGGSLVAVEVKYRSTNDLGIEAVNPRSQKRIIAAAEFFRARHPHLLDAAVRFDIVTVTPFLGLRHHKNAWYDF